MHNRVDLVISDHVLPDAPGADLLGEMKRANASVPVVLLSGFSETPAGVEQADIFLTKGMAVPDFLAAIAELLSRRAKSASSVNS
jgi:DNA-binding response OmpR family regulator